ncbi:MAG: peptide deformylase [Candidatus Omnitrophota bacterium]|nr:peptide deformylase [Candidatus Omnitrophota bacterium]
MSIVKIIPEIKILGEPILRRKAKPLKYISETERKIFEEMARIMHKAEGIGIAANQIGIDKQMLVLDIGHGVMMLANPKIIKKEGVDTLEEGCLSIPGIIIKVRRPKKIVVECLDKDNCVIKFEAVDILSRALQHEIDHLNGKLIIDYAGWRQRLMLRKKIKQLKRQASFR